MKYGADKLKFEKIDWLIKSKMTLKVKVNQPHFKNTALMAPKIHILCKLEILDRFLDELWQEQASTYGQTDGRTDGGNDNTHQQNLPSGQNLLQLSGEINL